MESSANKPLTLKIDSLAYGPYGIGRRDRQVIMVPLTAPGDEVRVRITEEKANYALGELLHLVKPSPFRQDPPCPYFGVCGGCPWQHIGYEAQLAAKEKSVADALSRIGGIVGFQLLPIVRSPQEYHYRRRIRLQCDKNKRLGFHRASSHELIEIDSCLIGHPEVDRCLTHAREWVKGLRTEVRHVEIVRGDEEKQILLVAKAEGGFAPEDDAASSRFLQHCTEIGGLTLFGRRWRRSWGQGGIVIRSEEGLRMEVDGEVFTQVNREGNIQLARELLQWGKFDDADRVLELYCGAGNFTLPVARNCREVVAVESNPRAIENGRHNGQLSQLENVRWVRSDVSEAIRRLRKRGEKFSKIILNPPRPGAKGAEEDLPYFHAEKILYVSCDPSTLARDLAALGNKGYKTTRVQPIDLFPHTFHVEVLAEMTLAMR